MGTVFALVFLASIYALLGYLSRVCFVDLGSVMFRWTRELNHAASTIAAVVWPLAWPALLVTMIVGILMFSYKHIAASFKVVAKHIEESMRGNK